MGNNLHRNEPIISHGIRTESTYHIIIDIHRRRKLLNRIAPTIEEHLIKEQAGFRPGKSCTSLLLNLTQHIEDGYQVGKITGTAFVDLFAAYDTVNHRLI